MNRRDRAQLVVAEIERVASADPEAFNIAAFRAAIERNSTGERDLLMLTRETVKVMQEKGYEVPDFPGGPPWALLGFLGTFALALGLAEIVSRIL